MLSYFSLYLMLMIHLPGVAILSNPGNISLLAGEIKKDWRIQSSSADANEAIPSCKSNSERVRGNTFMFFANGSMEWDNGEVTEGHEENGCGDFRDLVGEWSFINDQTGLVWTLKHDKYDPSIVINDTDTLTIEKLENNILILSSMDQDGNPVRMSMVPR